MASRLKFLATFWVNLSYPTEGNVMAESLQWAYHSPPYSWVIFHPLKHPNRIGVNWSLGSAGWSPTNDPLRLATKANSFLGRIIWEGTEPLRFSWISFLWLIQTWEFHRSVSSLPIMFKRDLRYPKNPSVSSFPSHPRTFQIPYESYTMETYGYPKIHEYIYIYIYTTVHTQLDTLQGYCGYVVSIFFS